MTYQDFDDAAKSMEQMWRDNPWIKEHFDAIAAEDEKKADDRLTEFNRKRRDRKNQKNRENAMNPPEEDIESEQ